MYIFLMYTPYSFYVGSLALIHGLAFKDHWFRQRGRKLIEKPSYK
jgi:hypothetical protein